MKRYFTVKSATLTSALYFIFVLTAECGAEALQPEAITAEAGVSMLRFNYAEYKNDGSTFNRELGGIPGLSFRLFQRRSNWEWEGAASYHYGRVGYNGLDSNGLLYSTRTDESVGDFALRLGYWFEGGYPVMPYAGLGYLRWDRNIRPASLSGVFESYRWNYAWLGTKIKLYQQNTSNLMLDLGWIKPLSPSIYGDAYKLSPASRDGIRVMLTSHMALAERMTLILEPYFEYWHFGVSPAVPVTGGALYEPESRTRNLGVNLRLGSTF